MTTKHIPWAGPHFWGNEEAYVLEALRSSWISGGPYVERLEDDFARYCKAPHAVSASNGTTALHMAYLALDIGPGDEVIVPGFAFMAAANVALHVGATPVFTDVDPQTWCMRAEDIEPCITAKTKAIVPVHTYGGVCDMTPIMELAQAKGLTVIEDAAEAIGSKYRGRMAGTIAPVGTYSFHATKTITTGEGGAVVTHSVELRDRMRLFRSHGMSARRYWHEVAGHNFRLTNMQAAIGCAQLEQVGTILAQRSRVYKAYVEHLGRTPGLSLQGFGPGVDAVVWALALELDPSAFPQGRDAVIEQLLALGIETRPGFHSSNEMAHLYGRARTPACDRLSQHVISLPSTPTLTQGEIDRVCESLLSCRK
jgi:perosamine synthetase